MQVYGGHIHMYICTRGLCAHPSVSYADAHERQEIKDTLFDKGNNGVNLTFPIGAHASYVNLIDLVMIWRDEISFLVHTTYGSLSLVSMLKGAEISSLPIPC